MTTPDIAATIATGIVFGAIWLGFGFLILMVDSGAGGGLHIHLHLHRHEHYHEHRSATLHVISHEELRNLPARADGRLLYRGAWVDRDRLVQQAQTAQLETRQTD